MGLSSIFTHRQGAENALVEKQQGTVGKCLFFEQAPEGLPFKRGRVVCKKLCKSSSNLNSQEPSASSVF